MKYSGNTNLPKLEPHEFEGRLDRWCTKEGCNKPDRDPIHITKPRPNPEYVVHDLENPGFETVAEYVDRTSEAVLPPHENEASKYGSTLPKEPRTASGTGVHGRHFLACTSNECPCYQDGLNADTV